MNTGDLRAKINTYLERVEDERFLHAVHSMLDTYLRQQNDTIIGYTIEGHPIYASTISEEYAQRVADMKAGQAITIEDLKKEASEW